MASNDIKMSNTYNATENEKKIINHFVSKYLFEKELKFKRQADEVECIINGVNDIVEMLMTDVGDKEPLLAISRQYLVGSMAEETSIFDTNEFDFLVVLKHFSEPGAISFRYAYDHDNSYYVLNEKINTSLHSGKVLFNTRMLVQFEKRFMSNILMDVIKAKLELFCVETDYGKLTIKSKTVCHHGPASVVKLRWEPKSESSKPLEILIDITPCIEQKGIHKVLEKDTIERVIPDLYKSQILNDDTFMLIPTAGYCFPSHSTSSQSSIFIKTITTTEVKIVNTLSSHHKTCYMILKYCFNTIIINGDTVFASYLIKTFLLRHVVRYETEEKGHRDHGREECLFECLLDITDDLKDSLSKFEVDGIFGTFDIPIELLDSKKFITQVIDNVMQILVQIGKEGYSVDRHEDFRKACQRKTLHNAIQERADKLARCTVECHLSNKCQIHNHNFIAVMQVLTMRL